MQIEPLYFVLYSYNPIVVYQDMTIELVLVGVEIEISRLKNPVVESMD